MGRTARIERATSESKVVVELDLDGTGRSEISTGVGFYDHMLTALSKHSLIDLTVRTEGDLHIDAHHTVEDTAIAIGAATNSATNSHISLACGFAISEPRGCSPTAAIGAGSRRMR